MLSVYDLSLYFFLYALGNSMTALTDIPHFKEMIIMAFDCELCGFRNSEIRGQFSMCRK